MVRTSLLLSLSAGCVMPPDAEELPALVNHPPRIVPSALDPAPQRPPKVVSTRCTGGYTFFAAASDPDEDLLFWRVFIDYHRDPRPFDTEVQRLAPQPDNPVRPLRFHVDPNDPRFGNLLTIPHKVELLVADRLFIEDLERQDAARTPRDDGEIDTFVWTVELTDREDPECVGNN